MWTPARGAACPGPGPSPPTLETAGTTSAKAKNHFITREEKYWKDLSFLLLMVGMVGMVVGGGMFFFTQTHSVLCCYTLMGQWWSGDVKCDDDGGGGGDWDWPEPSLARFTFSMGVFVWFEWLISRRGGGHFFCFRFFFMDADEKRKKEPTEHTGQRS